MFIYLFVDLFEGRTGEIRGETDWSSIHWFTPQRECKPGLGQVEASSQELHQCSHTGGKNKLLRHHCSFPGELAGSKTGSSQHLNGYSIRDASVPAAAESACQHCNHPGAWLTGVTTSNDYSLRIPRWGLRTPMYKTKSCKKIIQSSKWLLDQP